jgi:hypothetical protein
MLHPSEVYLSRDRISDDYRQKCSVGKGWKGDWICKIMAVPVKLWSIHGRGMDGVLNASACISFL